MYFTLYFILDIPLALYLYPILCKFYWRISHPILSKNEASENVGHHSEDTHPSQAVSLKILTWSMMMMIVRWMIGIISELIDDDEKDAKFTMPISPRCKDCSCPDKETRCRNQSSFRSYSVGEKLNNALHWFLQT